MYDAILNGEDEALDYALSKLYRAVRDSMPNKSQKVKVVYYDDGDVLRSYSTVSKFLVDNKIVEKVTASVLGETIERIEVADGVYDGEEIVHHAEITYALKPEDLVRYMTDTSRIPKYWLTLDRRGRVILNDKYIIITPWVSGTNGNFIEYVIVRPGKIMRTDIPPNLGLGKRRFHQILEKLFSNADLKRVFFPRISGESIEFRESVTTRDIENENIREEAIIAYIRTLKPYE